MPYFLRLLEDEEKENGIKDLSRALRQGVPDARIFQTDPEVFQHLPSASFAYWVDAATKAAFLDFPQFESAQSSLVAKRGVNSNDDFRFLRAGWEVDSTSPRWVSHPKGGPFSPFYADLQLVIDWHPDGRHLEAERITDRAYASAIIPSRDLYFRPGLTWSLRTKSRISMRIMPEECVFGSKGPAVIEDNNDESVLLSSLAICNSDVFYSLIKVQLAAADAKAGGAAHSFEVGVIQRTPFPEIDEESRLKLASFARLAWSLKRNLDTIVETSHAFNLPGALRERLGVYDPPSIEAELANIQAKINKIAFGLYGFEDADRAAMLGPSGATADDFGDEIESADDSEDDDLATAIDQTDGLLSWAVGAAFGRFDWRLATGEREASPEPGPFDPLPAKSPGMLPDGAKPFHDHNGILVDDQGHAHDLPRLIEEVLARVDAPTPADVRRWLQRDLFPLHLKQYSKSRRKAPIYWPISTVSSSYTLWLYYPSLNSQTLYTAINDFIEGPNGKLSQVGRARAMLREKGSARSSEDEKRYEALQVLELELIELRDTLLQIAPTYHPNHDDGVQITAAPLWQLFRHKPWQKILKDTWAKLEKGDYDWAHLAMAYWPTRVREKCKTDKSLAIAHDHEHLYVETEPKAAKARGRKKDAE